MAKIQFLKRLHEEQHIQSHHQLERDIEMDYGTESQVGHSKDLVIQDFVENLNTLPPERSALVTLGHLVDRFFRFGPDVASFAFAKLQAFAIAGPDDLTESRFNVSLTGQDFSGSVHWASVYPWNSCKMAATLVLLFAAPKDRESLFTAVKTQSRSLGGLPSLKHIRETPTASFEDVYQRAKQLALGRERFTSVMAVTLTDVHIFELAEQGKAHTFFSFAHVFVVAVGPEGSVIWQSWGQFGYGLDEYLSRGDGRLRTYKETDQFGAWTAKRNKIYKKLFSVDLIHLCGPKGPEKPLVSKFRPWVRIHTFEDVKREDVTKFRWIFAPS